MSTIWVATNGSAGGSGSEGSPFATVNQAVAVASNGDTIKVKPGRYDAAFSLSGLTGVTIQGVLDDDGLGPLHYGGKEIFNTVLSVEYPARGWAVYSGNVYRVALDFDPKGLLLWRRSGALQKGWLKDSIIELTAVGHFYYDSGGGYLYLYNDENPRTAFKSVDFPNTQGTASTYSGTYPGVSLYGGGYADGAGTTFRRLRVYGFFGNGILVDDASGIVFDDVDVSFNLEDGAGGFGMPDCSAVDSEFSENGRRRARDGAGLSDVGTDGDGFSLHSGYAESTNFSIKRCVFRKNTKSGVQNIHGSSGVVESSRFFENNFNLVCNVAVGTPTQTFRNVAIYAGPSDLCAIGLLSTGTMNLFNATLYGVAGTVVAGLKAFWGSALVSNCIIAGFETAVAAGGATLAHDYNLLHGFTTRGWTKSGNEVDADPRLLRTPPDFAIPFNSPAVAAGADLSAYGYTTDGGGNPRVSPWHIGAFNPTPNISAFNKLLAGRPA